MIDNERLTGKLEETGTCSLSLYETGYWQDREDTHALSVRPDTDSDRPWTVARPRNEGGVGFLPKLSPL